MSIKLARGQSLFADQVRNPGRLGRSAITVVGVQTAAVTTSTSSTSYISVTGTLAGDHVALFAFGVNNSYNSFGVNSPDVSFSNDYTFPMTTRTLVLALASISSDGDYTFRSTMLGSGSTSTHGLYAVQLRGVDASDPFDSLPDFAELASSTSYSLPAVTTTTPGSLVCHLVTNRPSALENGLTGPSTDGWTSETMMTPGSATYCSAFCLSRKHPSPVGITAGTTVTTAATARTGHRITVAFRAAP